MKDIVERLKQEADDCREYGLNIAADLIEEAAREIEKLRSLIDAMKANR